MKKILVNLTCIQNSGRRGHDRMVVGFTATCALKL